MSHKIIDVESVDSTNRLAAELAEQGCDAFTAVIAENQTAGRGRLGKNWQSPSGKGLYCSVVLRPRIALERLACITLVIGICVAEAIEELCGNEISVMLKWPNDLYVSGRKLGGILVEANGLHTADSPCIIAGIGVNLLNGGNDLNSITEHDATSVLMETGQHFAPRELLHMILKRLEVMVISFERSGFVPFLPQWQARDYLQGRRVKVVDTARKLVEGKVRGIDEHGQMRLVTDDGHSHHILSGDISLAQ